MAALYKVEERQLLLLISPKISQIFDELTVENMSNSAGWFSDQQIQKFKNSFWVNLNAAFKYTKELDTSSICLTLIYLRLFNQRILLGGEGAKTPPYLTPKSKVMGTPNLICGLAFTKIFWKN